MTNKFFVGFFFSLVLSANLHAQGILVDSLKYGRDTVYLMPDYTASFPGGKARMWEYIKTKFDVYAEGASFTEGAKEGTMEFSFVVEQTGKIKYIVMNKSISSAYDDEMIRTLLSMPKWQPATYKGKKVRSLQTAQYTLNFYQR
ncbi:MAG: putative transporter [Chitinophagaceae bacterium]|nr:putative transporter [Chitinophagaceae bacterium]